MNELRIILLIAGVLLIVGLYVWGMRGRTRSGGGADTRKPAVFTGTADSFEKESPPLEDEPAVAVESSRMEVSRRIEPSLSGDSAPATHAMPSRREPTWSDHDEGMTAGRRTGRAGDTRIEPSLEPSLDHEPETDFDPAAEPEIQQEAPPPAPKRPQKIIAIRVNAVAPARLDGARLRQVILAEGLEFGRYDIFHRLHTGGRPVFSVASLREPGTFDLEAMPSTQYPGVALFVVLPGPLAAAEAIDEMVFTARALAAQLGGSLADDRGVPLTPLHVGRLREDALEFERSAGIA